MRCATCDTPLAATPHPICARCAFTHALALGDASGATEPARTPAAPFVAGYEALYELGRGSMGVVWLARDLALGRLVALKLIPAGADPRFAPRLLREGRAIAQLRHPHIVAVHALGEAEGTTFLAMDFLSGGDLQARLGGRPLAPAEAVALVSKLADALAHAHAAGVVHRDLKPSNILLDDAGEPQLADFGLAAPLSGAGDLTAPGQVAGTPAFLAPELVAGADRASVHSDLYGLGAVLYVCLTGRAPFVGESAAAVLAQIAQHEPPSPRALNPRVPRDLETLCLKCLEKAPVARYESAEALREDLGRFRRGEPLRARPLGRLAKLARWGRRKPALAAVSAFAGVLLLTLAIGGPFVAWRMARDRADAVAARQAALAAEERTREQLREALLARSRALRLTGQQGQRAEALAAAEAAARIRPGSDARNEVIAALALPELRWLRSWPLRRNPIEAVAFAPDHDRYVVENPRQGYALHRLSDGARLHTFSGASAAPRTAPAFSPDGRFLVVRDAEARVLVWRDDREPPVFVLAERPYALRDAVGRYGQPDAFSPDGATLASALPDAVALHATADGREWRRFALPAEPTHVAYSHDGARLAVGRGVPDSGGGTGRVFLLVVDARTGAEISRLPLAAGFQTLAWSGDGDSILVTGKRLEQYDAGTGELLRSVSDPRANHGLFGPEGTFISSNHGGVVTLWDPATARPMLSASLGGQPEIAIDRAGRRIVKSSLTEAHLYALDASPVVTSVPSKASLGYDNVTNHGGSVVDYSDDGRWIAAAVWGAVHLRDAATGELVAQRRLGSANNHGGVRYSRDQRSLLSGSRELGLVRVPVVHEPGRPPRLGAPATIDAETGFMLGGLSHDGRRAALVSFWRHEVKVVPLEEPAGSVRWALRGAGRAVFLADDREVLANSTFEMGQAALVIHDTLTGRPLRVLPETRGYHVRTSADGRWVVLGTSPHQSVLRLASDWSPGPVLPEFFQGAGKNAAFSRDGAWLAIARGGTIGVLRTADGELVAQLETARAGSYVPDLAFSPDGGQLALCWENGLFTLWDLRALRRELAARGLDW